MVPPRLPRITPGTEPVRPEREGVAAVVACQVLNAGEPDRGVQRADVRARDRPLVRLVRGTSVFLADPPMN